MSKEGDGSQLTDSEASCTSVRIGVPRRRGRRWAAIVVGTVAVAAIAVAVNQARSGGGDALFSFEQRPAPAFSLPDLSDPTATISLDGYDVPVVLNIWASWCVPCRREMPALQAANTRYGNRVQFIGINHQDTRTDALAFLAKTGVTYPSAFDPDGATARTYGAFGLPTTYFITAGGDIIATKTGELTPAQLDQQLERLTRSPG